MTSEKITRIQCVVTVTASLLIIAHLGWPRLMIDGVTLGLLFLAVSPWLAPLFKSVELPGGMKLEFREFQEITDKAMEAGMISPPKEKMPEVEYSFLLIAKENPALALAGLRMEIERRLRDLATQNGLIPAKGGLRVLANILSDNQLLTPQEKSILFDIAGTLNKAVHNEELDSRVVDWIIDVGPRLLSSLEGKMPKKVVAKASCLEHDMANWGHEKSERIVQELSFLVEEVQNDFAREKVLKEKYASHISSLLTNGTKLFSFFSDAEWDVKDVDIILAEGEKGFDKVKHRYNRA
jgi:hypothetical protein